MEVASLGALSGVVGRHHLQDDIVTIGDAVAITHDEAVVVHVVDGLIGVDGRSRGAQTVNGFAVEVVAMLMGDEDDIGFGKLGVVSGWQYTITDGVDLNLEPVVLNLQTGVLNARNLDFLTVFGGEDIGLLGSSAA